MVKTGKRKKFEIMRKELRDFNSPEWQSYVEEKRKKEGFLKELDKKKNKQEFYSNIFQKTPLLIAFALLVVFNVVAEILIEDFIYTVVFYLTEFYYDSNLNPLQASIILSLPLMTLGYYKLLFLKKNYKWKSTDGLLRAIVLFEAKNIEDEDGNNSFFPPTYSIIYAEYLLSEKKYIAELVKKFKYSKQYKRTLDAATDYSYNIKKNNKISLYYNPDNPSENSLEVPQPNPYQYWELYLGFLIIIGGLVIQMFN